MDSSRRLKPVATLRLPLTKKVPKLKRIKIRCLSYSCRRTSNFPGVAAADQSPYAYLAMNALGFTEADGDRVRRRLEMNWFGIQDIGEMARIQLLSGSPDGEAPLLVDILAEDYPGGYYTTDIELPTLSMEELGWALNYTDCRSGNDDRDRHDHECPLSATTLGASSLIGL